MINSIKNLEVILTENKEIKEVVFFDKENNFVILKVLENSTYISKENKSKRYKRLLKKYNFVLEYVRENLSLYTNKLKQVLNSNISDIKASYEKTIFNFNVEYEKGNILIKKIKKSEVIYIKIWNDAMLIEYKINKDNLYYNKLDELFEDRFIIDCDTNKVNKITINYNTIDLNKDNVYQNKYKSIIDNVIAYKDTFIHKAKMYIENKYVEVEQTKNQVYIKDYKLGIKYNGINEDNFVIVFSYYYNLDIILTCYSDSDLYKLINENYSQLKE